MISADTALRAARRYADLSQRELADRAGVSRGLVGDIESSRRQPRYPLLCRLLLAATTELMLVGFDGMPVNPPPYNFARDRAARQYPAHLDVRRCLNHDDWWYGRFMTWIGPPPPFTFDRARWLRDLRRNEEQEDAACEPT